MKKLLESSRFIVMFGVLGTFLAALALFFFGFLGVLNSIYNGINATEPYNYENLKSISIILLHAIDIFLLATVLYIIAMGLFELFIDDRLELPKWLEIHTLDDLKSRMLGVVVVILPVSFLGKLSEWKSGLDIVWLGVAVAVIMLSIAVVQYVSGLNKKQ